MRALSIAIFLAACEGAHAQDRDPFAAIESGDPIELARLVDRVGDAAVLDRLEDRTPRPVRLAAIRACPALHWPEAALERLAQIASSRDPDLAPAAARSLRTIADALSPEDLERREVAIASLAPARASMLRIAADRSARPDIRLTAEHAAHVLEALGVN
jgi:hypothetical protein